MPQNQDLLRVARDAAARAGDFVRATDRPTDPSTWDRKAQSDFVTEVDRGAEQLIAKTLRGAFPSSVVAGEELSPNALPAALTWIVDPLDGTTNYLHRYPAYAVSIAAVVDGEPAVAVVADVSRSLTYHAVAGAGAWCGAQRLRVSPTRDPANALLGTGFPFKQPAVDRLDEYLRQFATVLPQTSGIRRAGSAALDLAHVAEGRLDGFWELWLAPWDVAAGILLIREAGGTVTDLAGNPARPAAGPILAGNPWIHSWLLETLTVSVGDRVP